MDHLNKTRSLYRDKIQPILTYSTRRRIDILLDFTKGKNVLDLGCVEHESSIAQKKNWWLHGLIAENAKSILGIDYDRAQIENLQSQGYNVCVGDVENLSLNMKYDIVIAGELFEHLTNHRQFLNSVANNLNNEGLFVASMPNANSLNYFMQTLLYKHELDAWDHTSFFTPTTLTVMLQKCGFEPVKYIIYQPNEIFHHESKARRTLAYIFNKIQQIACMLRPQLARGLIVVARRADSLPNKLSQENKSISPI